MKRKGFIFEKIVDMENLRVAYWKAKRGKGEKREIQPFREQGVEDGLLKIRDMLLHRNFPWGKCHEFTIFEPKKRNIVAPCFEEVIVHHAIMNVCETDFDRFQIDDSYACRKGKGQYAALEKAIRNHRRYKYCVKMDVRKYFDSIDRDILIQLISKKYKDHEVIELLKDIIWSYRSDLKKGIPIGNLLSQYFANHYLGYADHYVKENIRISGYVRYMDDMMLWGNDRDVLLSKAKQLREFLKNNLSLELKVFSISPSQSAVNFLGYKLSRFEMRLSASSSHRYIERVKNLFEIYDEKYYDDSYIYRHISPAIAFVDKANSSGVKKKALEMA